MEEKKRRKLSEEIKRKRKESMTPKEEMDSMQKELNEDLKNIYEKHKTKE